MPSSQTIAQKISFPPDFIRRRELPGSGLGLTIVKRCTDLHGGSISFRSTEGIGSTFAARIPAFPAP
jgi:signal transduction histidine kinase